MAIFNEILSGRYNRALQKIFAIKGSPPVRQVSGEIQPIITVDSGVENRVLEFWSRWSTFARATSAAAQLPGIRIRNPIGSDMIAVIEKLWFADTVAGELRMFNNVQVSSQAARASGTAPGSFLDSREPAGGRVNHLLEWSLDLNAGLAAGSVIINQFFVEANKMLDFINDENQELTVAPGFFYDFIPLNPGVQTLLVAGIWRERKLEESELK